MSKKIKLIHPPSDIEARIQRELNDQQYLAAIHSKGPALVIAGAGSGKTRTITYRVSFLLEHNTPPENIMLVTFTKKAAQEMIERVIHLVGERAKKIKAGTFHHIANLALRKHASLLGFQSNYTIMDPRDQRTIIKLARNKYIELEEEGSKEIIQSKNYPSSDQLARMFEKQLNHGIPLNEVVDQMYPQYFSYLEWIKKVQKEFVRMKRQSNSMDFNDLMIYFRLFLTDPQYHAGREAYLKGINHLLVDEYQDVNHIQAEIVDALGEKCKSVFCVGDDAQAIYGFRGSNYKFMLDFPTINAGTQIYKLEQNYRSTPEILDLANAILEQNQHKYEKTLQPVNPRGEIPLLVRAKDVFEEALVICSLIIAYKEEGIPFHEQAILIRSNNHRLIVEKELIKQKIPYEVRAGLRFYEQAHIKDFIALIAIMVNPHDSVQWIRALIMHSNIGEKAALKITNHITSPDANYDPLTRFLRLNPPIDLKGQRIARKGFPEIQRLQKFFKQLLWSESFHTILPLDDYPSPSDIFKATITYLTPIIPLRYPLEKYAGTPEDRITDLNEIMYLAKDFSNLLDFMNDILSQIIKIGNPIESHDDQEEEKPLIISTIHQAKGLEWDCVYIPRLTEGGFPSVKALASEEDLEEERRVFYVACTRARKVLCMLYPSMDKFRGMDSIAKESPFLQELEGKKVFSDEIEFI